MAAGGLMLVAASIAPVTATSGPAALLAIGIAGFPMWLVWVATFGVTLLREPTTTSGEACSFNVDYL